MTCSRTYGTRKEAKVAMIKELKRHSKDGNVLPCTGILWPDKVTVRGTVFKI